MRTRPSHNGDLLSRRALNRALLERQLLRHRCSLPVTEVIEHLVGMQAQAPMPPYYGLWTRLAGFRPDDLAGLITDRQVVRIVLMRGTVHLVTARDCLALRPVVAPVLERGLAHSAHGKLLVGFDTDELVAAGRELVEQRPRTGVELGELLSQRWPDRDATALSMAVRCLVPLVQLPPRGIWGASGQPTVTTAEAQLRAFRDEHGRELLDLPDAPRPDPDTPAPVRLLPEFDNVLLSHADRTRVISDEHRKRVGTRNGMVPGSVLVDGFFRGTWKITRSRSTATLTVDPYTRLSKKDAAAVTREGARLLAFAAADAGSHDIRITPSE